jgi:hypothetical protein
MTNYLVVYKDLDSQNNFCCDAFDAEQALEKFRDAAHPESIPLAVYSLVAEVERTYKLKSV